VERTVTLCRTTFDARIALEVRCDPAAAASLDASQLEQVLLNLLLNARDAVAGSAIAAPRIGIDVDVVPRTAPDLADRDGDHVRLRVSDNGIGMDRLTQARMFEPFFTTKAGKGTGLGLATTLTIVMEHGGFIECASSRGEGTTLSIWLPAALAPAPSDPVPPGPQRLPTGHETVLVVDDEPQVRDVVEQMLGDAGYTALVAASGDEVVALLADRRVAGSIALVLLDVSLPGMPRPALRAHLRRLAPQARVIAFTGYPAQDIGDDDPIVEKPASASQLLGAIRAALSR
jgi:CheY-like chemotaxis protein